MRAYFHLPCGQTEGVVISHASTKFPGIHTTLHYH